MAGAILMFLRLTLRAIRTSTPQLLLKSSRKGKFPPRPPEIGFAYFPLKEIC